MGATFKVAPCFIAASWDVHAAGLEARAQFRLRECFLNHFAVQNGVEIQPNGKLFTPQQDEIRIFKTLSKAVSLVIGVGVCAIAEQVAVVVPSVRLSVHRCQAVGDVITVIRRGPCRFRVGEELLIFGGS